MIISVFINNVVCMTTVLAAILKKVYEDACAKSSTYMYHRKKLCQNTISDIFVHSGHVGGHFVKKVDEDAPGIEPKRFYKRVQLAFAG